jgi:hypothetical protein
MSNPIAPPTKSLSLAEVSDSIDLGSVGSVQLMYAKLQLMLSEANKKKALSYMDEVLAIQEESKQLGAFINQLQASKADKKFEFSPEIKEYMDKNGIQCSGAVTRIPPVPTKTIKLKDVEISGLSPVTDSNKSQAIAKYGAEAIEAFQKDPTKTSYEIDKGTITVSVQKTTGKRKKAKTITVNENKQCKIVLKFDKAADYKTKQTVKCDKDQFDANITALKSYQEQLGSKTQSIMVFVNDFMAQYSSFLTGANSSIEKHNQTLTTILSGR